MAGDVEFGPTWYSDTAPLPQPRAALAFDLDVDVCVVGGGLAGLSVLREVVRRGWSAALLEAKRIAWNASGRNAGFVTPGFAAPIESIVERVGLPAAKQLWRLSETGVAHVRETLAELGLREEGKGWLDVSPRPAADAELTRLELLGQEFGADVEAWPQEQVRNVLKTYHYFHAIHYPRAFQINPLAYALALAHAAETAGAHIFEHTPAIAIDPVGVRKRVVTAKARLRAAQIVLAGNIHLGAVDRRLGDTLISGRAFAGVTRPLGRRLASAIAFAGGVSDQRAGDHRYRIVGGDRLLWSGISSLRHDAGAVGRRFEHEIHTIYPQIGRVEFESLWQGDIGVAVHRMPQIGEVRPGVWLASGFGGQGLNTAALAGRLIASAIVEGDQSWQQFLPYELVWAGGRTGRVIFWIATAWSRQRERFAALIARRREERVRRRLRAAVGLPAEPPRPAYQVVDAAAMSDPFPRERIGNRGRPARPASALPIAPLGPRSDRSPAPAAAPVGTAAAQDTVSGPGIADDAGTTPAGPKPAMLSPAGDAAEVAPPPADAADTPAAPPPGEEAEQRGPPAPPDKGEQIAPSAPADKADFVPEPAEDKPVQALSPDRDGPPEEPAASMAKPHEESFPAGPATGPLVSEAKPPEQAAPQIGRPGPRSRKRKSRKGPKGSNRKNSLPAGRKGR